MRWTWAALLAHELLARAGERAQLLDRYRRYEARADQPVGKQIGEPRGVVHVGLASGDVLDVTCVGQHQLEVPLEDMPDRLPIHAGGFHRRVRRPRATLSQSARASRPERGRCKGLDVVLGGLSTAMRTQATTVSLCTSRPAQRG